MTTSAAAEIAERPWTDIVRADPAPRVAIATLWLSLLGTLLGVGVLMVYSASITSRPTDFERVYLARHLAAAVCGLFAAVIAAQVPVRCWQRWAPWLFAAVCVLLVVVLIPGVGTSVKGARRWLRIGGVSLQPSELAKLVLPLWTCLLVTSRSADLRHWWRGSVPLLWPTAVMVPLVLLEPDLGTSLFLLLSTALALYLGGWPISRFLVLLAAGLPCCVGLWWLKPYQVQRLVGFVDTWQDLDAAPYQVKQSLVTLGAGGWGGTGLGKGWQKLSFLPEANTDFVFAVIGEELGLSGTLGLIAVWCGVYVCGVRMLSRHDPRSWEFVTGVTLLTLLVVQALLNVGVVTAMLPPKGIAHPLISAGGSNLVVSLLSLGLIWRLSQEPPARPVLTREPGQEPVPAAAAQVETPKLIRESRIVPENDEKSGEFSLVNDSDFLQ